jgi:hypothetical protein
MVLPGEPFLVVMMTAVVTARRRVRPWRVWDVSRTDGAMVVPVINNQSGSEAETCESETRLEPEEFLYIHGGFSMLGRVGFNVIMVQDRSGCHRTADGG